MSLASEDWECHLTTYQKQAATSAVVSHLLEYINRPAVHLKIKTHIFLALSHFLEQQTLSHTLRALT
ncbi:hypothetical protein PGTUg99_032992 [Puccinia graminis f. sp. tritici]|uniref:Uncharacterized protein n=1 Tax=Puccinia graminis f. sp. tritici TaxID=56615 RepID=A0A5B0S0U7_PUCGR|nr:hypothetical protein PGTUg99_032992 [Puccinia graminis f. sp. tritici]